MATTYTYNGITFSNVSKGVGLPNKYGNATNGDFTRENSNVYEDGIEPFVNAVEIDWNGANLGSYIINSTAQLLSYMSTISEKIAKLEDILINLDNY